MTVKELIDKLNNYDEDDQVLFISDYELESYVWLKIESLEEPISRKQLIINLIPK